MDKEKERWEGRKRGREGGRRGEEGRKEGNDERKEGGMGEEGREAESKSVILFLLQGPCS